MKIQKIANTSFGSAMIFLSCSLLSVMGAPPQPTVGIQRQGTNAVVQFTGRLQSASQANGPYTNVPGAVSPYVQPTSIAPKRFWRARLS